MDVNLIQFMFACAVAVMVLYLIVIVAHKQPSFYSLEGGKTVILWLFLGAAILSGVLAYLELKDDQNVESVTIQDLGID